MTAAEQGRTGDVDAVVIGAGFSGLYMLHKLRDELGLVVRVFEAGGGVGGTWYWNRYPGARSDSDSYIYGFMFDEDLWRKWEWSERYPEQHEIRAYLEHVAQRYDLNKDITFGTRVAAATFDEDDDTWTVTTDAGESVRARYVIAGVGALSVSNTPRFDGIDSFRGESYHTGRWPHEKVDFTGKRVGVIGTGASAVQAVPLIARIVADLRERGASTIEPTPDAESAWVAENQQLAEATLFPTADTWYMGANIPGKPRVFLPNLSFVGPYRAKCDRIADNEYEGFSISTAREGATA
jgi:cation diffusion facilitator CzcD-associated flavoprotein CzcO